MDDSPGGADHPCRQAPKPRPGAAAPVASTARCWTGPDPEDAWTSLKVQKKVALAHGIDLEQVAR